MLNKFERLQSLSITRSFIDEEQVNEILEILEINSLSDLELVNLRNEFVKFQSEKNSGDNWTIEGEKLMSAVTAVIDHTKFQRGLPV